MKRSQLEMLSDNALALRNALPKLNSFSIGELTSKPSFFDWVECTVSEKHFVMYLAGSDDGVALKFFWNGVYETHSIRLWASLACADEGIKLDIGAHTGVYSLAAQACGGKNIFSFEPHFANYSRLMINLKANDFPVKNAYMLAVSDQNGWNAFHLPTRLDYLSTGGGLRPSEKSIEYPVRTVALDSFLGEANQGKVSAMKIDVEGHEMGVLSGALKTLEKSQPIIFFECIDDAVGVNVEAFLSAKGYAFFVIDDSQNTIQKVTAIRPEKMPNNQLNMSRLNRLALPMGMDLASFVARIGQRIEC
jgi:FkbM family methyltransferase